MWIVLVECRCFQELEELTSRSRPGCGRHFIASATPTHRQCFCPGCGMEHLIAPPSGMMSPPLERRSLEAPISSSAASRDHARISALRALEQVWQASEADLYLKSSASLASADPSSFSWRTFQLSLFGGSTEFSWNSMRWGLMRDGQLFRPQKWEPRTLENESGFLPTPVTVDGGAYFNKSPSSGAALRPTLGAMAKHNLWPERWRTPNASDCKNRGNDPERRKAEGRQINLSAQAGGALSPRWTEWLMGYPIGWTELGDLETQWFRSQRGRRSKGCSESKQEASND